MLDITREFSMLTSISTMETESRKRSTQLTVWWRCRFTNTANISPALVTWGYVLLRYCWRRKSVFGQLNISYNFEHWLSDSITRWLMMVLGQVLSQDDHLMCSNESHETENAINCSGGYLGSCKPILDLLPCRISCDIGRQLPRVGRHRMVCQTKGSSHLINAGCLGCSGPSAG